MHTTHTEKGVTKKGGREKKKERKRWREGECMSFERLSAALKKYTFLIISNHDSPGGNGINNCH